MKMKNKTIQAKSPASVADELGASYTANKTAVNAIEERLKLDNEKIYKLAFTHGQDYGEHSRAVIGKKYSVGYTVCSGSAEFDMAKALATLPKDILNQCSRVILDVDMLAKLAQRR